MYAGLMRELAKQGFRSVACNQRGYSPGARPEGIENYHYSMLRDDIFAVAEAMNFSHAKFHLVGHDHGAALGWYTVTSEQGKSSILSYSALSVPHLDAFSASACCFSGRSRSRQNSPNPMAIPPRAAYSTQLAAASPCHCAAALVAY